MNVPPSDDAAHEDGLLMHEISKMNDQFSRYVLRFLDADAGRTAPLSVADEQALATRVAALAARRQARAQRRAITELPGTSEGAKLLPPGASYQDTQTEQR